MAFSGCERTSVSVGLAKALGRDEDLAIPHVSWGWEKGEEGFRGCTGSRSIHVGFGEATSKRGERWAQHRVGAMRRCTTGGTAPAVGSQHSAMGSRVGWWEPHTPMKNCKSSTTARMVFEKKLSWGFAEHKHHPVWFVTVAAAEPKIDCCPQRITGGAELWLLTRISSRPPGL